MNLKNGRRRTADRTAGDLAHHLKGEMTMYRQYENPYKLEEQLKELQARRAAETNLDVLISLDEEIAELKDRINFAWQDDEYDSEY